MITEIEDRRQKTEYRRLETGGAKRGLFYILYSICPRFFISTHSKLDVGRSSFKSLKIATTCLGVARRVKTEVASNKIAKRVYFVLEITVERTS